jgi:two-component system, sensor histidine kinase and response regulator
MDDMAIRPEDYTILAVDDVLDNILLLKALLHRAKYNVISAMSGVEALAKVKNDNPDLMLLDIMMPEMDGFEVLRQLREMPDHENMPVIMLTALHGQDDIIKAFNLGATDFIMKPFKYEDLVSRVNHHIKLASALRLIIRQRNELKESMEARDKMYSVIAHDLRSPIGTLKMLFNMLMMNITVEQVGQENVDFLSTGNEIAEKTFMLLDNLLKWTKSSMGRLNTVFQVTDLCEVVVFATKMFELMAGVKHISIEYNIPDPILVKCDVDMMKTIMRNLISNAIKFSNEGSKIIVSITQTDNDVTVSVRDFGVGMDEQQLEKLISGKQSFTTFGTKNEEGSGLGLQLCRELVNKNEGKFHIDSKQGEGSTFSFTLAKAKEGDVVADTPTPQA